MTLTFPSSVVLSSTPVCSYLFGFKSSPTCSASANVLRINNAESLNGIRLRVSTVQNPGSAQNIQNFIIRFYNSASQLLDQSQATAFYFQFTTDQLTGAFITPGSQVVGAVSTWTLQITPKNQIPAGGFVKLFMPKWVNPSMYSIGAQSMMTSGSNSCNPGTGLTSSSVSCQFVIDPISTNQDVLTISNAFAAAQTPGSTFTLTIDNIRNMPTTRPYSNFDIVTYDSNNFGIDTSINQQIQMTMEATLPSSQVKVIINAPTTVDSLTTYLFQLFINNPIPMGGSIRVRIPPTVGAGSLTSIIQYNRINPGVTVAPVSSADPNYVVLSNGFPTIQDSVQSAGVIGFQMMYLKNPSSPTQTASFQIETWDGPYIIEKITTGLEVISTTGSINMNNYLYSEPRVLEYNSFTFDMTLQSALQSGCAIEITFPSEFIVNDVATGNCKLIGVSGLSSASSCAIVANKLVIMNPFGSSSTNGGDRVKFTVANNYVQNPTSTRPTTSGISIKTLSYTGSTIDTWTGSKFKATENSLSSVTITPSSYVAGLYPVTYTFVIRTPRQVEQDAQIYVKFPSGDPYVYDTSMATDKCSALQTLSSSYFKCSATQTSITATKGFSGGVCACQGDISFSVGGIANPRSLKVSDTFTVSIYTNDNYLIYTKKTGITVKMTEPDTLTTVSVSQVSGQNGALDNYIFSVNNHNQNVDGDYMVIKAPPEVTFTSSTSCAARSRIRGFYSCKFQSPDKITAAFQYMGRRLGTVSVLSNFEFVLTNILNAPSMAPSSQFSIQLYSVDNYLISNILQGPTVANRKAASMSQISIKPSVYADGRWTNLTFSLIPNNYMQFMTMTIQIPSDVLIVQAAPNICQVVSAYSVSKEMSCDYFQDTRTVRIVNAFQQLAKSSYDSSSILLKQLQFMVGQFINPVGKTQSGSFNFTTYDKSGYIIDSMTASISYVCSSQCATCSKDDYTKCTSCPTNSQYKYLYLGGCVQQCPNGTTEIKNKCLVCPFGCTECSTENDSCLVCNKGLLFFEGSCIKQCPDQYVLQEPSSCVKIVMPVTSFISYFQKTDNYQCFMFPFTAASVFVFLVMIITSICSKFLVKWERTKIVTEDRIENNFLNPIRLIEVCIALISLVELGGWVFFLYCMIHVEEKLPFYVICGAIGLNLFLNFIMTCGIMKSKENYDLYLQKYSEAYSCTYRIIKFFTLFVSHKGFFFSFARYQRGQQHSHFDFSYFDAGDEEGVSGMCFKFFFLVSVILLHGAVIAACVLNYLTNELDKKLFCLDLDIIAMTGFQALLVLMTLLQCGAQQISDTLQMGGVTSKIHPKNGEYNEEIDVEGAAPPDDKQDQKKSLINSKQQLRDKITDKNQDLRNKRDTKGDKRISTTSKIPAIQEEDEDDIEGSPDNRKSQQKRPYKKGTNIRDTHGDYRPSIQDNNYFDDDSKSKQSSRLGRKNRPDQKPYSDKDRANNKIRQKNEFSDPDYSRHMDKTIDPLDYEDDDDIDDYQSRRETKGNNRRPNNAKKNFKRGKNDSIDEGFGTEDNYDYSSQGQGRSQKQQLKKRGKNNNNNQDYIDSDTQQTNSKYQRNRSNPRTRKQRQNNDDEDIQDYSEEESEQDDDQDQSTRKFNRNKDRNAKNKKKKNKKQHSDDSEYQSDKSNEEDDSVESDSSEEIFDEDGQRIKKKKKKSKRKQKKQRRSGKIEDSQQDSSQEEESESDDEESDPDSDESQNPREGNINKKKKQKNKKNKKQKSKKQKNGRKSNSNDSEEPDSESDSQVSEEDGDDQSKNKGSSKQRKNKKKKIRKQAKKSSNKNAQSSDSEEEDSQEDEEGDQNSKSQKRSKKAKKSTSDSKKPNKRQSIDNKKSPLVKDKKNKMKYEEVSHNASSNGDSDFDQKQPHFEKVTVDKEMSKLDLQQVVDGEEPSYKDLVDQINNQTQQHFRKASATANSIYGSINGDREQPKGGQDIEESKRLDIPPSIFENLPSKQINQEEQQLYDKISSKYGIANHSLPTQHEEDFLERNNAQFGKIKESYPTQYDEKFYNDTENQSIPVTPQNLNQTIKSKPKQSSIKKIDDRQLEDQRSQVEESHSETSLPVSGTNNKPHEIMSNNDQSEKKAVSQQSNDVRSMNHSQGVNNQDNGINQPQIQVSSIPIQPNIDKEDPILQDLNLTDKSNQQKESRVTSPIKQELQIQDTEVDKELDQELRDTVNKHDIKPAKTKIIFSDKSESSVEDLMEDTPSNYNLMNGRLEEESKGHRSLQYKAISKKHLYQNIIDKSQGNLQSGNEDEEARNITPRTIERKYQSQVRPPSSSSSQRILEQREKAKLFIKMAESTGIASYLAREGQKKT